MEKQQTDGVPKVPYPVIVVSGPKVNAVEHSFKLSHAARPNVVGVVVDGGSRVTGVGGRVVGSSAVNAVAYLHVTSLII